MMGCLLFDKTTNARCFAKKTELLDGLSRKSVNEKTCSPGFSRRMEAFLVDSVDLPGPKFVRFGLLISGF
jgi:hypothetical protein